MEAIDRCTAKSFRKFYTVNLEFIDSFRIVNPRFNYMYYIPPTSEQSRVANKLEH